ncbi:nuclear transport factor 2 family protein [Sansalvadorimonas sp. 2012CJ34-2]|uniref:Nuclear transport factor 2 family protein n=1 Tax=Parendozoicomonas callyspongiae TaxID=2942213 RepID=A0ABT0PFY9_9GAMM|nr:nuclear transport factor 2 family protein [Sansalvadorimonas sp. 2012CJ34-2]MCL6269936.1 nuclear transport factor 2 family protein [Sansalvadorimonas sp. 2012CJ34-2]
MFRLNFPTLSLSVCEIAAMRHDSLTGTLNASKNWIKHFNSGDVDYCVSAYMSDAEIKAAPLGEYNGWEEIDNFWRPFVQSGATDLVYSEIWLRQINDDTVHLGANWIMNVGRGVINLEEWKKTEKGVWKLNKDDFEIQEQFT